MDPPGHQRTCRNPYAVSFWLTVGLTVSFEQNTPYKTLYYCALYITQEEEKKGLWYRCMIRCTGELERVNEFHRFLRLPQQVPQDRTRILKPSTREHFYRRKNLHLIMHGCVEACFLVFQRTNPESPLFWLRLRERGKRRL